MGVYMSQPCREKHSFDEEGSTLCFGASSMQGWRKTQEDAHNCTLEYEKEKNMSLFAVYDGHGGAEVAQYTALNFPDFLKSIAAFKEGKISQSLEDAFLEFDEELLKSDVMDKLKDMAGAYKETEEERQDEVKGLFEEADMPLEQLLQRYQAGGLKSLRELRKGEVQPSPALRGKKGPENTDGDKEDIKENLEEKLVNGEGDCNGDHMVSENNTDALHKDSAEVTGKGDSAQNDKKPEVAKESNDQEQVSSLKSSDPECRQDTEGVKVEAVPEASECSEAAASGPAECQKSQAKDRNVKSAEALLPDSTQQPTDSTADQATHSTSKPKSEANGETEVSSSSEGAVSKEKAVRSSASSSEDSGSNPTSSGGSSVGVTSEGSAGGGSSSLSAPADSSSKAEPCSSSGRTRSGRKNVIPEEGEDESSFDEDEETTDEEDSDEEGMVYEEEDSEDSEEDSGEVEEFIGRGEVEEGEDEEEEERVYSMEPGFDSGCTAVVALLKGRELFVSNAGDSRCVVCREGKAVDMSFDHKPEDLVEMTRIHNAGGQVTTDGRVNGGLNLSRAIGDHAYKKNSTLPLKEQMISALPDVRCVTLDEKDEFMVLACDGIWNSLSSQETVTFIKDRMASGAPSLSTICEELFECCLAPNTEGDGSGCDNMTCIIVKFKPEMWKLPASSVKRRASSEVDSSLTDPKKAKEGD